MELTETPLPGCYLVRCDIMEDERGRFVKTYHDGRFAELGLRTDWREEYYSVSAQGVLRGMHFQIPPADHAKLAYCVAGEVLDVVVDLRHGSPTFERCASFLLSAQEGDSVYVPPGLAHGFVALRDQSVMQYKVTTVHSPEHDAGILWDSLTFDWPILNPILSSRDARHPRLADFQSPFFYGEDTT
jgi:dTDP-4-dehydrorhamnose 3,5-epimerase